MQGVVSGHYHLPSLGSAPYLRLVAVYHCYWMLFTTAIITSYHAMGTSLCRELYIFLIPTRTPTALPFSTYDSLILISNPDFVLELQICIPKYLLISSLKSLTDQTQHVPKRSHNSFLPLNSFHIFLT